MKKLSAVCVVITLLLLSACLQKTNKLFDINYNTYYSDSLRFVTEKENYFVDDTVIYYSVTNISDEETCIPADEQCFALHKLVDGEWNGVETKIEHYWTEAALLLPPNQTEVRKIDLEKYYHLPLEKGVYRIAMEQNVSNSFEIS